jgi:hypothetical protein
MEKHTHNEMLLGSNARFLATHKITIGEGRIRQELTAGVKESPDASRLQGQKTHLAGLDTPTIPQRVRCAIKMRPRLATGTLAAWFNLLTRRSQRQPCCRVTKRLSSRKHSHDGRHLARMLRARPVRPCRRATQQRDELASP